MPPKSLLNAVRDRYLASIRSVQPPSRWKILVVDTYTQSLLNQVLKLNDILQQNVSTVENIEHNRHPQPSFEACYLLTPTSANVDRIIRDLTPRQNGETQYAAAHIFFVDSISDSLLQRLTSSPVEPSLRQLVEIFTNFWPTEAQTFSLKSPRSLHNLFQPIGGAYGPDQAEALRTIDQELYLTTQTLLNICVTLNEFPLIRYYNPSHPALGPLAPVSGNQGTMNSAYAGSARLQRLGGPSSSSTLNAQTGEHFTKKLALSLQQAIDDYVRDNEPKQDPGRPRGVLFITDRTMDPMAPFLHEFTYQAMANDLLPIQDGVKYSYRFYTSDGQREDKDATLSDEDQVWTGIRHLHIAEAIDKLAKDFQAHAGEAGAYTNDASSLNDMRDMLASLPHMQEMKDKLSLHLTMAQDCMGRFEKTRLPQQAMVEQNCATRLTPEGQKPRTLVEEMVPLLDDRNVSNADKVRIIALYIMYCEGVNDEDRKRLFQHARLSLHEMDAVNHLVHLGVQVVKDPSQSSAWNNWLSSKGKRKQQATADNEYELSRYQPLVKLMIEDHFAGKLDQTTYPYVRDAPPEIASAAAGYLPNALASSGRDSPLARVTGGVGLRGSGSSSASSSARPAGAPSSLRSAKPTWHQKPRGGGTTGGGGSGASHGGYSNGSLSTEGGRSIRDETRQRVLVFVAGGMTYSEIRSVYQISSKYNKDGYIGSSDVLTPEGFINTLKSFGKASGGVPNGNGNGHHSPSSHMHQGHLPQGATSLSPPSNETSGLMSKANRALKQGHNTSPRGQALTSPTSPTTDHYTSPSATPQRPNYSQQGHANTFSGGTGEKFLSQQQQQPMGTLGRTSTTPNISAAAEVGEKSGAKKRMKNVFGFKKS
ncbi:unnamed protein product [Sympodiomycopsis kandeliae]